MTARSGVVLGRVGFVLSVTGFLWLALVSGEPGARGEENRPAVVVRDASAKAYRTATQRFAERGAAAGKANSERFRAVINEALEFSGLFKAIPTDAFLGPIETTSLKDTPV